MSRTVFIPFTILGSFTKKTGNLDVIYSYFKENPESPEFFYFVHKSRTSGDTSESRYDLQFVESFSQLRKGGYRNLYYTISSTGVTRFTSSDVKFTPIEEWFRERKLWNVHFNAKNITVPPSQKDPIVQESGNSDFSSNIISYEGMTINTSLEEDPRANTESHNTFSKIQNDQQQSTHYLSHSNIDIPKPLTSEERNLVPLNIRFSRGVYFRKMQSTLRSMNMKRRKIALLNRNQGLFLKSPYGEYGISEGISEGSSSSLKVKSAKSNKNKNATAKFGRIDTQETSTQRLSQPCSKFSNPTSILSRPLDFILCSGTTGKLELISEIKRYILVTSLPLLGQFGQNLRQIISQLISNSLEWQKLFSISFSQLCVSDFSKITSVQQSLGQSTDGIPRFQKVDINSTELYLHDNGTDPEIAGLSISQISKQSFHRFSLLKDKIEKDNSNLVSSIIICFQKYFQYVQLVKENGEESSAESSSSSPLLYGPGSNPKLSRGGYNGMIEDLIEFHSSNRSIGTINSGNNWIEFPSQLEIPQQILITRESTRLTKFLYLVDILLSEAILDLVSIFISDWKSAFKGKTKIPIYKASSQKDLDNMNHIPIPQDLQSSSWELKKVGITLTSYLAENKICIFPSPPQVSKVFLRLWKRLTTSFINIPSISSCPLFDVLRFYQSFSLPFVPRIKTVSYEYPRDPAYLQWEIQNKVPKHSSGPTRPVFRHLIASSSVATFVQSNSNLDDPQNPNTLQTRQSEQPVVHRSSEKSITASTHLEKSEKVTSGCNDPLGPTWTEVLEFTGGALRSKHRFSRLDDNGMILPCHLAFLKYSGHSRSLLFLTTDSLCTFSCEVRHWVAWSFNLLSVFADSMLKSITLHDQWYTNIRLNCHTLGQSINSLDESNYDAVSKPVEDQLPDQVFGLTRDVITNIHNSEPTRSIPKLTDYPLSLMTYGRGKQHDPHDYSQQLTTTSDMDNPEDWDVDQKNHLGAMVEILKQNIISFSSTPSDNPPKSENKHSSIAVHYSTLLSHLQAQLSTIILHWRLYATISAETFPFGIENNIDDMNLDTCFQQFSKSYHPNPSAALLPPISKEASGIFQLNLSPILTKSISNLLETLFSIRAVLIPVIQEHQSGIMNLFETKLQEIQAPLESSSDYVKRSILLSQVSNSLKESWNDQVDALQHLFKAVNLQHSIQGGVVFSLSLGGLWHRIASERFRTDSKSRILPKKSTVLQFLPLYPQKCVSIEIGSIESAQNQTIIGLLESIEESIRSTGTMIRSTSHILQFHKLLVEERKNIVNSIQDVIQTITPHAISGNEKNIRITPKKNSIILIGNSFLPFDNDINPDSDSDVYCEFNSPSEDILDISVKTESLINQSEGILKAAASWDAARQVLSDWFTENMKSLQTDLVLLEEQNNQENQAQEESTTHSSEETPVSVSSATGDDSNQESSLDDRISLIKSSIKSLHDNPIPPEYIDQESNSSILLILAGQLNTRNKLITEVWNICQKFLLSVTKWMSTKTSSLDVSAMIESLQTILQSAKSLKKKLPPSHAPEISQLMPPESEKIAKEFTEFPTHPPNKPHPVLVVLQEKAGSLLTMAHTIKHIQNPSLQIRHWTDILPFIHSSGSGSSEENVSLTTNLSRNSSIRSSRSSTRNQNQQFILRQIDTINNMNLKDFISQHIAGLTDESRKSIAAISSLSSSERALKDKFYNDFLDSWESITVTIEENITVGLPKLTQIDDLLVALDDTRVTLASIQGSRYVQPILKEVEEAENGLKIFIKLLHELSVMQTALSYQTIVFREPDIRRQLPEDPKTFMKIRSFWIQLLSDFIAQPLASRIASKYLTNSKVWSQSKSSSASSETDTTKRGNLVSTVQGHNASLEIIQKHIQLWLDVKRQAFSRFYFLNNDELLSILSRSKDPRAIQPHLSKCFEGLYAVIFVPKKDPDNPLRNIPPDTITGFKSSEGEEIQLRTKIKCRGAVEKWASQLESEMKIILRQLCKKALIAYSKTPRHIWATQHAGQLVLVVSAIYFCREVEEALTIPVQPNDTPTDNIQTIIDRLGKAREKQLGKLSALTDIVRTNCPKLVRRALTALITMDIHHREILDLLIHEAKIALLDPNPSQLNNNSFIWKKQLRYYWNSVEEDVIVEMVSSSFQYGWEYLGCSMRLVVTALTGRCYVTCLSAIAQNLGASPQGPAGTGKTETVKDLAKAMGLQCVVFNCGDTLDAATMGRFFSGLAQTGAWVCFDEFNRLRSDVLSVVATQLLTIRRAILARAETLEFEGENIRLSLDPTMAVFITMNPGYAGRAELPANLKALFRPVSMMRADYERIAEVMLFSQGFQESTILARKMFQLYQLSAQQLSPQKHYDFGMRAIKSLLVMAGALKRASPNVPEHLVLIRALRDSNLPKFVHKDLSLFQGLISDLWPGIKLAEQSRLRLEKIIIALLYKRNYRVTPMFVAKIIQFFDTLVVRHGAMIVGPPGTGKTVILEILAAAMKELSKQDEATLGPNEEKGEFYPVHIHHVHPKSISPGELYGEFISDDKWIDGIVAQGIKTAVDDKSQDFHWILFDGPVDAVYIENMNTSLDDNKMLCLDNGERIKMSAQTRLIFEVTDLSEASPATISRCGMVYVGPEILPAINLVYTWLLTKLRFRCYPKPSIISQNQSPIEISADIPPSKAQAFLAKQIWALVDLYLDNAIELLSKINKPWIHLDHEKHNHPLNHTQSLLSFLTAFLDTSIWATNDDTVSDPKIRKFPSTLCKFNNSSVIRNWFMFCFVWGLGGALKNPVDRVKFSDWILQAFDFELPTKTNDSPGYYHSHSQVHTIYDYCYIASTNKFVPWDSPLLDILPEFSYSPSTSWQQIIVPTTDVLKFTYLSNALLRIGQSVLITGPSSVGKTLIANRIQNSVRDKFLSFNVSLNPTSVPIQLVESVEQHLDRLGPSRLGGRNGKNVLFVLDDVHRVFRELYGALGSLEMARQFLEYQGFYDPETHGWKEIHKLVSLAVRSDVPCDGLGNKDMSSARFLRHFTILSIPDPSADHVILSTIYVSILSKWLLHKFNEAESIRKTTGVSNFKIKSIDIQPLSSILFDVTYFVFSWVIQSFNSKPDTPHYRFSIRDVDNVFLGITSGSNIRSDRKLCRLWIHEMCRVFVDRLTNEQERSSCMQVIITACEKIMTHANNYRETNPDLLPEPFWTDVDIYGSLNTPSNQTRVTKTSLFPVTFGAFSPTNAQQFVEIDQRKESLPIVFADYQESFNIDSTSGPMKDFLIFFQDTCTHLTRVLRALHLPETNLMLVGPSGTGKRTLVRFACKIFKVRLLEIRASKSYNLVSLFEDLKSLCISAGIDNRKVAVLVPADALDHPFLEAINTFINSYEIPYFPEELEVILSAVRVAALSHHKDSTPLDNSGVFKYFINQIAQNLTVFVTTSPGELFRQRVREFPAFLRCTIDWFEMWTKDALFAIGRNLIRPVLQNFKESVTPFIVSAKAKTEAATSLNSKSTVNVSDFQFPSLDEITSLGVFFHSSALIASKKMQKREKRTFIITPGVFLGFLSMALHFVSKFCGDMLSFQSRLALGIKKLNSTNEAVQKMQLELQALQPVLEKKAIQTEEILSKVNIDKEEAAKIQKVVNAEAEKIAKETAKTKVIADDAQKDLDEALPALQAAVESLNNLSSSDISEVKAFSNPPALVKTVMEAICILFQVEPSWKNSKLVLGQSGFIKKLIDYDKDNIPESIVKKLRVYMENPDFHPEIVQKVSKASTSLCMWARSMDTYNRVIKIVTPKRAALAGAQSSLAILQEQLDAKQQQLDNVKEKISKLEVQLEATLKEKKQLSEQVSQTETRLNRAQDLIVNLSDESVRWNAQFNDSGPALLSALASSLVCAAIIGYLGPFSAIWRSRLIKIWTLRVSKALFFSGADKWNFIDLLSSQVEIRNWQSQGLPLDSGSSESAVIMHAAFHTKWPLIIDPQEQAKSWIMLKETSSKIQIISAVDISFLKSLRTAVEMGYPVLLQDVDPGTIESNIQTLEPILLRSFIIQGDRKLLKIGDDMLEFHPNFRLYMTTTINSPLYSPTVFSLVNVINFSISSSGLENQLLSYVVKARKPELEQQAADITRQMADDRSILKSLEDRILELLSKSSGNILDDEELINTLKSSKIKSREINDRMILAIETSKNIEIARNVFRPVAEHSVLLYNVVSHLQSISSLYIYSLSSFIQVFVKVLATGDDIDPHVKSQHEGDLKEPKYGHRYTFITPESTEKDRLVAVCEKLTWATFTNFSRGLFNRDKLSFASALALALITPKKKHLWVLLNSLSPVLVLTPQELEHVETLVDSVSTKIASSWLTKTLLLKALLLSAIFPKRLTGLSGDLVSHPHEWKKFLDSENYMIDKIPRWKTLCDGSHESQIVKLCILVHLNPSRSNYSFSQFVSHILGTRFILNSPLDLHSAFKDASPTEPIFYLLVPGIDPTAQTFELINDYKKSQTTPNLISLDSMSLDSSDNSDTSSNSDQNQVMTEYDIQLIPISLGQGVLPRALAAVKLGIKRGDWVFLQNLHLVPDFLSAIASQVATITSAVARGIKINPHFRLFLSAEPCSFLPPSILKSSLKLSQQPPKGIRNTVSLAYETLSDSEFFLFQDTTLQQQHQNNSKSNDILSHIWPKLLFNLFVANSLINGRLVYGPLGMNIQSYGFGMPDLQAATFSLRESLSRTIINSGGTNDIPWDEINYMTAEICYGGRVTDDWDRVMISTLIQRFYNSSVLNPQWNWANFKTLSENSTREDYIHMIQSQFPTVDSPFHFWLDPNADLALQTRLSKTLVSNVSLLQDDDIPPNLRNTPKKSETAALENDTLLSLAPKIATPAPKMARFSSQSLIRPSSSSSLNRPGSSQGLQSFSSMTSLLFETENVIPIVPKVQDPIISRVTLIIQGLPELIQPLSASDSDLSDPLNFDFLSLEIDQANILIKEMKNSLSQLLLILDGQAVAKEVDIANLAALRVGQLLPWWKLFSYESPKTLLDSWLEDFYKRIKFLRYWRSIGGPLKCYWLPGLFDQRAFLKFVLQLHARRNNIPLDELNFTWKVMSKWSSPDDVAALPEQGVYIHGLFLDAARWNENTSSLDVQLPDSLFARLPVLQVIPTRLQDIPLTPPNTALNTPLYKTPVRKGLISTTGLSNNFIIDIPLPIKKSTMTDDWILKSTALLCTLEKEPEK